MKKTVQKFTKSAIDSTYFSVGLVIITILFLFVLFRMKVIEQQYSINNSKSEYNKLIEKNKALKAKMAKEVSIKKLKDFAKENNLKEPSQKQIIIIKNDK